MTAAAPPADLRFDSDFRRYWLARVVSLTGSIVTLVAMPVLVYRLSGSAFLTAAVTALEAAPYLLFGLVAGALTDRWNRRRVMITADLLSAAVIASVPLAAWLGELTVAHVLVAAFVVQALFTFFDGANFGALPVLVGRSRIASANAAVWGASSVAEIAVPSLVGVALAVVAPATLLAIDALTFIASAVFLRAITRPLYDASRKPPALTAARLFGDVKEGVRFLVRHAGVRTMTVAGALQSMAGGGFVSLMVVWCDRVLGIGTSGWRFGLVFGSFSAGGLIAALALPRLLRHVDAAAVALRALPVSAVLGVAAALASSWQWASAGLLGWGFGYTMVVVNSISYRQQVTPEPLLGRVNTAGRVLAWGVGWTLGAFLGGTLGHLIGLQYALVSMASITALAVVVAWTSPLARSKAVGSSAHTPAGELG
jgi:MFS family permease